MGTHVLVSRAHRHGSLGWSLLGSAATLSRHTGLQGSICGRADLCGGHSSGYKYKALGQSRSAELVRTGDQNNL